jgi:signal transduction histidine kinase
MDTRKRLDVKHLVEETIALLDRAGKKETLERIADPEGPFTDGEHYVFALDLDGNLLAHPFSKQLVGHNLADLRDSEGRDFIKNLVARAKSRGSGFVDYKWPVPDSKKEFHKTLFFERVDGMVLCSGFYSSEWSPMEAIYRCFLPFGPC